MKHVQELRMKTGDVCASVIITMIVGSPSSSQHLCVLEKLESAVLYGRTLLSLLFFSVNNFALPEKTEVTDSGIPKRRC
jgi:hypothetical protein